jgi:hypothetical protein
MKDLQTQKKHFILSSFARLGLTINKNVHQFTDKFIQENHILPSGSLDEVDAVIEKYYKNYITGH